MTNVTPSVLSVYVQAQVHVELHVSLRIMGNVGTLEIFLVFHWGTHLPASTPQRPHPRMLATLAEESPHVVLQKDKPLRLLPQARTPCLLRATGVATSGLQVLQSASELLLALAQHLACKR